MILYLHKYTYKIKFYSNKTHLQLWMILPLKDLLISVNYHFNLESLITYSRVAGNGSKNYTIDTTSGEYIIKFFTRINKIKVRQEIIYMNQIRTNNFLAVELIQSGSGSILSLMQFTIVCLKKVTSEQPNASPEICQRINYNPAKIHSISVDNLPIKMSFLDKSYLPTALQIISTISTSEYIRL